MDIDIKKALLYPLLENTIGNRLGKQQLLKGVSKNNLAGYINSTHKTIALYGFNRSFPSPKRLIKIAQYLDVPLEYFLISIM